MRRKAFLILLGLGLVAPNVTVNLLAPDDMRGARVNQLDLRVGKVLRFASQRATVSVDMFNALNADNGADIQPGIHAWRRLARADDRADGAHGEDHCAVRLLIPGWWFVVGGWWFSVTTNHKPLGAC